jgi:hypothetical protein
VPQKFFETPTPADFALLQKIQLSGVEGDMETVKWLWNKHFAAVTSDNIAFEALPPVAENGEPAEMEKLGKIPDFPYHNRYMS